MQLRDKQQAGWCLGPDKSTKHTLHLCKFLLNGRREVTPVPQTVENAKPEM